jgi:hypothetical protein
MLSHVPVPSLLTLRTDKVNRALACRSHFLSPDVASETSLLYDVRSGPADKAQENGNLIN